MAEEGFLLEALMLSGFRAYLEPKAFDFSRKQNLAVFAPNRSGKSSIIDALEFMFSEEGTLERLGIRTINNQAGVAALAHYLAADRQIDSKVGVTFRRGKETFEGTRSTGGARPRPSVATAVGAHFLADPIIRGHSLRRFVEERTAEDRYADIAGWLQLSPLVTLQRNLRNLRQQVKASAEDLSDLKRVDVQLGKETAGAVARWDHSAVLAFINEQLIRSLDANLTLASIDRADNGFLILAERAKIEDQQIGLAGLRQIKRTASALYEQQGDAESPNAKVYGLIPEFESAVHARQDALSLEAQERNKAANALFADLWEAAEPIFRDGVQALATCPLCDTPIADTRLGSLDGIREHIEVHLAQLHDYAAAKKISIWLSPMSAK